MSEVIQPETTDTHVETPEAEAQVPAESVVSEAAAEPLAEASAPEPDVEVAQAEPPVAEASEPGEPTEPEAEPLAEASSSEEPSDEASSEEQPAEPASFLDAADFVQEQTESLDDNRALLKAMVEAAIYITEEPLTLDQLSVALEQPKEKIAETLKELANDYASPDRGITVREVAGGFKMGTKPEHHERIRNFVKKLKPPLKLSLAALETLAVIAYKQPITAPEIMDVRGVQGAGVLKTLIDRKLITPAGRKQVVGKPILYKTTKEFLVQFGLKDLAELPTLKEFEELRRLAFNDDDPTPAAPDPTPIVAQAAPHAVEVAENTESTESQPVAAVSTSGEAATAVPE